MKKLLFLPLLFICGLVYAVPDTTMSITPSASDGTVITASDENTRNNAVTTAYNAHSHTDISQVANTLNVGDAAAGNKTITAYNADASKPFLRYNDTSDNWIFSTDGVASDVEFSGGIVVFEGVTDNAFETTLSIDEPTADRTIRLPDSSGTVLLSTSGVVLPSGAVFYMITGSCPTGTTDVSATYANKFIKTNATQGTSSGVVLTGASDSHTLTLSQTPAHSHAIYGNTGGSGSPAYLGGVSQADATTITVPSTATESVGGGTGHTHNLSTATTLEPSSVTMKLCQVS